MTLIQLLIVTGLMGIAGTSILTYFYQMQKVYTGQNLVGKMIGDTHMAMRVVTEQIRMAGYGVPLISTPSAISKITATTSSSITFLSNIYDAHTFLTAAAPSGSTTSSVVSTSNFRSGDTIYIADSSKWESAVLSAIPSATSLALNAALTSSFAAGSSVDAVQTITFSHSGTSLMRNGASIFGNISALTFTYDAAALSNIRKIHVSLTGRTERANPATNQYSTITLESDVTPPNLGY